MDHIPKILHLYWDESPLSLLQLLTLRTFREYQPDWKIRVYHPKIRCKGITWHTPEQRVPYEGKDYLSELDKYGVERVRVDFEDIGLRNDIPEVIKSDYLRYYMLDRDGGVWSDFDVVYTKPLSAIHMESCKRYGPVDKPFEFAISYFKNHYSIGLIFSTPNNTFMRSMIHYCRQVKPSGYQCMGVNLMKAIFGDPDNLAKITNNEIPFVIHPEPVYLPYTPSELDEIFDRNVPEKITEDTIGIHWFNGAEKAKNFQNDMDKGTFSKTGSIYPFIAKYLE